MTYPSSRKTVLIGRESTWGTAVTTDKDVGVVQEIVDTGSREVDEVMGLGKVETQQVTPGPAEGSVTLTVKAQHTRLFEYALGSVAHAETTGDWKHTFSISTSPPSMTLESSEDGGTDTERSYPGMMVEKGELKADLTNGLTFKVDLKGKPYTSSATTTAAVIDTLVVFHMGLITVNVAGAQATECQEATIMFNKVVGLTHGLGDVEPADGQGNELKFEFSAKLGFASKTFQELYLGGTSMQQTPAGFEFEIDADNGVTLGSGQRRIKCTLENCVANKNEVSAAIGDLVFVDIAGFGTLKANETFGVDDISSANWG